MKYWKRLDKNGNTTTVESYSHKLNVKDALEINKTEFDEFIALLPTPKPPRDLTAEIDALDQRIQDLEAEA